MTKYDIVIIGGGPAGLTSAIYALRANKKVLVLEKEAIGGQISSSPLVENYPGFKSISGSELSDKLYEQVVALGGEVELEEVLEVRDGKVKTVVTDMDEYEAASIIVATGAKHRMLGLDREEEFIGEGISFCVSCDGAFYKDKVVAVIGGGNTAVVNAIYLSDVSKKVYVIQKLDKLTCEQNLIDKLNAKDNVEIIYENSVTKLKGAKSLKSIVLEDRELEIDGMFISIGQVPDSRVVKKLLKLNEQNYIVTKNDCMTDIEGVFVAGDCREKSIRQVTTAVNDGTISAVAAINYVNNL